MAGGTVFVNMYIMINGIQLYYERTGAGKPLLLLHGNGENHTVFCESIPIFAKHCTVYALDTRAHGKSDCAPLPDYPCLADDIVVFIKDVIGAPATIIGFSDGGIAGLLVAKQAPDIVSKLIVLGANTYPKGIKFWNRRAMEKEYRATGDPKVALMLNGPRITAADLAQIRVPVYVFAGTRDVIKKSHTRAMAKAIPNARLIFVRGANHEDYVKDGTKLTGLLKGALSE